MKRTEVGGKGVGPGDVGEERRGEERRGGGVDLIHFIHVWHY